LMGGKVRTQKLDDHVGAESVHFVSKATKITFLQAL
jgi:hypothetical protein